jgi:hypothetical protein
MGIVWHAARMGEKINAYTVSIEMREGKRLFGRRRRRWEHHINMELQEI